MLRIHSFTFNPIQENTYIIYNDNKDCIIVDPGCYFPEERKALESFINTNQLVPKALLNTHCHLDHVFGNKFVYDTWGLPLHIHPLEETVLAFAPQSGLMWNLVFENYSGPIVHLHPGENVCLGEDKLKILFTPGHSPGSVSFYSGKDGFLISGDVLFRDSIGRTDLPGGDFQTLVNSIQTQLWPLPDEILVYSGHGPYTKIGYEKKNNPFVGEGAL